MDSEGPAETVDGLRRRVAELEAELERLREEHRVEREHQRLRHQEHALGLVVEAEAAREKTKLLTRRVQRLKERLDRAQDEARRSRRELDEVRASRSWRLGRAITRPARGARR